MSFKMKPWDHLRPKSNYFCLTPITFSLTYHWLKQDLVLMPTETQHDEVARNGSRSVNTIRAFKALAPVEIVCVGWYPQ